MLHLLPTTPEPGNEIKLDNEVTATVVVVSGTPAAIAETIRRVIKDGVRDGYIVGSSGVVETTPAAAPKAAGD